MNDLWLVLLFFYLAQLLRRALPQNQCANLWKGRQRLKKPTGENIAHISITYRHPNKPLG
jgi:hypothetical protein